MKFVSTLLTTMIGFTAFAGTSEIGSVGIQDYPSWRSQSARSKAIYKEDTAAFDQMKSNDTSGIPELLKIVVKNLSVTYESSDCRLTLRNDYGKSIALSDYYHFQIKATIATEDFEADASVDGRDAAKIQGNKMTLKAGQLFPPTRVKMTFTMSDDGRSFQVKTKGLDITEGTANQTCTFETHNYKIN